MSDEPLLTPEEHEAMATAGRLAEQVFRIVGTGPNATHDWNELCSYIHGIQKAVLGQAAARAYPDLYRLLGKSL